MVMVHGCKFFQDLLKTHMFFEHVPPNKDLLQVRVTGTWKLYWLFCGYQGHIIFFSINDKWEGGVDVIL